MTSREPSGTAPVQPSRARSRAFVRFTLRNGRRLWLAALILLIPAAFATVRLYTRLSSEIEELLPRGAPSVKAIDELRSRMSGLQYLGVVVDAAKAENVPAAERFLDDLAARIRSYPKDLVGAVKTGSEEERRFVQKYAPLYADLSDLESTRARIAARRQWELSKGSGILLEDEPAPSLDFSDIEAKYQARAKGVEKLAAGRFSTLDPPVSLLLVEVGSFSSGADNARSLLRRVEHDIAALGGVAHYAPGMTVGFAADVAVSSEEISALASDLTIASFLVIAAVITVMLLYFRWWRSVPAIFLPLLVAVAYAFGLSTLPPFRVDRLNSNTAFLGSIIIGNGINFAILFLARYVEARRRGRDVEDSLTEAVWGARLGTMVAALAAGVAYGSLMFTRFRGFRQFGAIGGIGMLLCWAVTFLLVPPLVAWLDREPVHGPQPISSRGRIMGPLARFITQFPKPVALAGLVVTAAALSVVPKLGTNMLESDFSRLRRRDTWQNGERYWGAKMDRLLGRYLSPTVLLTDSVEQAEALAVRLRQEATRPPLSALVSEVRGPDSVLPPEQPQKIAAVEAIRRQLTPATRAAADPKQLARLDDILGSGPLSPFGPGELPASFTIGLRERDGSFGKAVLVFPTLSKANWQNENLAAFTRELRRVAAEATPAAPARVAGGLSLSADIVASISHDGPLASLVAFVGVLLLVLAMFRFSRHTLYVMGSLLIGVLWLTAAVYVFGIRINFVNFIAFPITFGIGVDYAVNVMARFVQDGERDVEGPVRSTGAAVGLCSMTTIIGYSSLLLAKNRGLFNFGLVAVLGEIACLTTAIVVLPAILLLVERRLHRQPALDGHAPSAPAQRPRQQDRDRAPGTRDHVVEDDAPAAR